jgi:hypothetical protein
MSTSQPMVCIQKCFVLIGIDSLNSAIVCYSWYVIYCVLFIVCYSLNVIVFSVYSTSSEEYNAATLPHFFELFNVCGSDSAIKPDKLADGTVMRDFIMENKRRLIEGVDKDSAYESRKNSWFQMERALELGKCKRIGVSNYTVELLQDMKKYANIMPAVNEVEFHPRFASPELLRVCRELNIVLIGYGTGHYVAIEEFNEHKSGERNQVLDSISSRTGKSRMQVVLRWMLQSGVVSIPRSESTEHMRQNRDIIDFELSSIEMDQMASLNENYPYYWDPVATNMTLA